MNGLCIIPARGGSKRIPRKNIRDFRGEPIIAYPIRAALDSGCFEEVMVSTDDPAIAVIARECGATVPFLRSAATAHDHAGSDEVLAEVILRYREMGRHFQHVCGLYPTAALTTAEHLRAGYARLVAEPALASVVPVVRFSYPVQRALVLRDGRAPLLQPEHYHSRSQDLEPAFHDAGQWYWLNADNFLRTRALLGADSAAIEISELDAQDIDNETDWRLAEMKFQAREEAAAAP